MAEFKRGRTSYQDEHRIGRPNEVTTPELVKKIQKMVLDDRRLKVLELADMVGFSKSAFGHEKAVRKMGAAFTQWNKNSIVRMFQSSVWRCFTAIKPSFGIDL